MVEKPRLENDPTYRNSRRKYDREYYRSLVKENPDHWRERDSEKFNEYRRGRTSRLRLELIALLGGRCVCGFDDIRALQIDHINGGGWKYSSNPHKKGGPSAYLWYLKHLEIARRESQVLCANCNWIKRYEMKEQKNYMVNKLPTLIPIRVVR